MMQPTPAPSSARNSPAPNQDNEKENTYPEPPQNFTSLPFSVLAGLFQYLQDERRQDKRRKMLSTWFNRWRSEVGHDLYPVLRLLLPQKDRERAVYGLKEKNLAKAYIKIIPLQPKDPDAIRLLHWKKPTERYTASGDFSAVLFDVVSKRSSVIEGNLSIQELNDMLDELSKLMGKSADQHKIIQKIYNRTTPTEQRWIMRIILKDMNISVKERTVFSVFHPDAEDLYNTCSDLKKVAWELWDPNHSLNDDKKNVALFQAFLPMLCQRPKRVLEDAVAQMSGFDFIIEEKLDGERMQLHKRGNEYFYCSRKGKDYTYLYGSHVGTGSLTPHIDKAFNAGIDNVILDGEMLVWDPVSEKHLPFGTLKTAALDKSNKQLNPRPCFKVFDLLYLNDKPLMNKSVSFRKKNLRNCFHEVKGRLEFISESNGRTAKDVRTKMEEVMANRGEGLILKHPNAKYVLNGRNNDWFKVKPEYMDNLGETVDVIVIAGNYGSGRRAGGVSTLICAVLDDRKQNDDDIDDKYSSFVRIGSGLSYADYVWVRSKPWKQWDESNPPAFYQTAKRGREDKGDLYLEPEDSFLLKIKAAEIVPSDQYHLGYTMRFPRAIAIRDDLTIADCMTATGNEASQSNVLLLTVTEVKNALVSERKRKIENETGGKKKKARTTTKAKPRMGPVFSTGNERLKDVKAESDLFQEYSIDVELDDRLDSGQQQQYELKKLIKKHGGRPCNTAKGANLVIWDANHEIKQIQDIKKAGRVDIIRSQWLIDSVAAGELVPMRKKYFYHATEERKEHPDYTSEVDDSATEDEDEDEGEDAGEMEEAIDHGLQRSQTLKASEESQDGPLPQSPKVDIDPSMAEWFDLGNEEDDPKSGKEEPYVDSDNDSDNEDVGSGDHDVDDWENLTMPSQEENQDQDQTMSDGGEFEKVEHEDVKMGEDDNAMHYDEEHIFRHLCFYLDSPRNAGENGMPVKAKNEQSVNEKFNAISKLIVDNGGRIVSLDDAKLTHVILHKGDTSRRKELVKRTSKPKMRNMVILEWIEACLDEETLLPEDEFAP